MNFCSEKFLQNIVKASMADFKTTLKQQSDYKSLIAKTFDGNTFKMNTTSPVYVIKNKK